MVTSNGKRMQTHELPSSNVASGWAHRRPVHGAREQVIKEMEEGSSCVTFMTKKLLFSTKSLRNKRAKKSFAAITFRRFFSSFTGAILSRRTCGETGVRLRSRNTTLDGEKFKAANLIRDSSLAPIIRWKLLQPLVGGPGLSDLPPDELFGWAVLLDPSRPGRPVRDWQAPPKSTATTTS